MSEEDDNVGATVEKNVGETTIKNLPCPPPPAQSIHTRGAEKKNGYKPCLLTEAYMGSFNWIEMFISLGSSQPEWQLSLCNHQHSQHCPSHLNHQKHHHHANESQLQSQPVNHTFVEDEDVPRV